MSSSALVFAALSGYESPEIYNLVSFSSRTLRSNSRTQGLSFTSRWLLGQRRGCESKTYDFYKAVSLSLVDPALGSQNPSSKSQPVHLPHDDTVASIHTQCAQAFQARRVF